MSYPPCLGWYARADEICDGDPRGDGDDAAACVFRDRCVAFARLVERSGKEREAFLDIDEDDARPRLPIRTFHHALNRVILAYGIKNGVATKRPGKTSKRKRNGVSKVRGREVVSLRPARERAEELAAFFAGKVVETTGRDIYDLPGEADPGELFIVDRMEKSGYASLYARGARRFRYPIAVIFPNRRDGSLQVRVAADFERFSGVVSKTWLSKLEPIDCTGKDGRFCVRLIGLDQETSSVVAETISRAIDEGIIELEEEE